MNKASYRAHNFPALLPLHVLCSSCTVLLQTRQLAQITRTNTLHAFVNRQPANPVLRSRMAAHKQHPPTCVRLLMTSISCSVTTCTTSLRFCSSPSGHCTNLVAGPAGKVRETVKQREKGTHYHQQMVAGAERQMCQTRITAVGSKHRDHQVPKQTKPPAAAAAAGEQGRCCLVLRCSPIAS